MSFVTDQIINVGRNAGKPRYLVDENGCWVWQGRKAPHVRGQVPSAYPYHRRFYEALVGPIPSGHDLHHECENRLCVNPAHMSVKDHAQHRSDHGTVGKKCEPGCTCRRHFQTADQRQKTSEAICRWWESRR